LFKKGSSKAIKEQLNNPEIISKKRLNLFFFKISKQHILIKRKAKPVIRRKKCPDGK
jgi:hypothetical protein